MTKSVGSFASPSAPSVLLDCIPDTLESVGLVVLTSRSTVNDELMAVDDKRT